MGCGGCGAVGGLWGCPRRAGRWYPDGSTAWYAPEHLWIVWGRVVPFRMFASPKLCDARLVGCEMRCIRGRTVRGFAQCMPRRRLIHEIKASKLHLFEPVTDTKACTGPVEPSVAQVGRS